MTDKPYVIGVTCVTGLVSQLLQPAAAVGFSLIMLIVIGALLIVILLHG